MTLIYHNCLSFLCLFCVSWSFASLVFSTIFYLQFQIRESCTFSFSGYSWNIAIRIWHCVTLMSISFPPQTNINPCNTNSYHILQVYMFFSDILYMSFFILYMSFFITKSRATVLSIIIMVNVYLYLLFDASYFSPFLHLLLLFWWYVHSWQSTSYLNSFGENRKMLNSSSFCSLGLSLFHLPFLKDNFSGWAILSQQLFISKTWKILLFCLLDLTVATKKCTRNRFLGDIFLLLILSPSLYLLLFQNFNTRFLCMTF